MLCLVVRRSACGAARLGFGGLLAVGLVLVFGGESARAVDGVIEINQASATAGGITPGDTAGFPVTLSQAGSYRLTGSLSPTNQSAIVITSPGVALDLNGFRIRAAAASGTLDGIDAANQANVQVRNGTVESFAGDGIQTGDRAKIENVNANNNGGTGISVGNLSAVIENNLYHNGSHGIQAGEVCTIANNIVEVSGAAGIVSPSRSTVTGNKVNGNGGRGIETGYSSSVSDNVATFNTSDGISAGQGSTIQRNTVSNNGGDGIEVDGFSSLIGNTVTGNARCGVLATTSASGWAQNVLWSNNGLGRQIFGTLYSLSDTSQTNLCNGGSLCSFGIAHNCP